MGGVNGLASSHMKEGQHNEEPIDQSRREAESVKFRIDGSKDMCEQKE